MNFAWPHMLWVLLALPAVAVLYWLVQGRRSRYAVRFTNLDLLANVVRATPGWRRHVPPILYLGALGLLVVSLARPQGIQRVPKEEATVVLLTDVSRSMEAKDVEPNRLSAARESAKTLVDKLPAKFQISLVSFSNTVRVVTVPTTDRDEVKRGIDSLTSQAGTAMGDGLLSALDIAAPPEATVTPAPAGTPGRQATPTPRPTPTPTPQAAGAKKDAKVPGIIVLLSDGANSLGSDPIDAATEALARNVPIYTIALGTPNGYVDITQNGATRRIQVPPDEETLNEIAEITGGKFFKAPTASDLEDIYDDLGSRLGFEERQSDRTWPWAAAAAAFMVAGAGLSLAWFNRFP